MTPRFPFPPLDCSNTMASTPKYPKLKPDVTTVLFRAIEARLKADPVLHGVVRNWRSWEGQNAAFDRLVPTISQMPVVRLSAHTGPEKWFSPETQIGVLVVQIEVWLEGTCEDDVHNFWGAIRRAFYNPSDHPGWTAYVNTLQSLGAHKGAVLMQRPLVTNRGADDGHWEAVGQVSLDYRAPAAS